MSISEALEKHVFPHPSSEELFNPYCDRDERLDRDDGPAIRRDNLLRYVSDHKRGVPLLLIAEAPGPWGCRFSGVPITSEEQLLDPSFPLRGKQSSLRPKPYSEYSANIFWRVMNSFYLSTFVWNTVPLHPHRRGEPLSIRTPRQSEVNLFLPLLEEVVRDMDASLVLAVGRKAENALTRIGLAPTYVRHPSQGGARLFTKGVLSAVHQLGLVPNEPSAPIHG